MSSLRLYLIYDLHTKIYALIDSEDNFYVQSEDLDEAYNNYLSNRRRNTGTRNKLDTFIQYKDIFYKIWSITGLSLIEIKKLMLAEKLKK